MSRKRFDRIELSKKSKASSSETTNNVKTRSRRIELHGNGSGRLMPESQKSPTVSSPPQKHSPKPKDNRFLFYSLIVLSGTAMLLVYILSSFSDVYSIRMETWRFSLTLGPIILVLMLRLFVFLLRNYRRSLQDDSLKIQKTLSKWRKK